MNLDNLTSDELGRLFPIVISEPDPEWMKKFEAEKKKIEKYIGLQNIIKIHHICSTAIPDLPAKPTIDILIEIQEETENDKLKKHLNDDSGIQVIAKVDGILESLWNLLTAVCKKHNNQ